MKAFRLIGMALLAMVLCTSCDLIAEKLGYKKEEEKSESTKRQELYNYPTPKPKSSVVKKFTVRAQIFKIVQQGTDFYEKATSHYKDLEITLYSDGRAVCTSIFSTISGYPHVRDSVRDGYDFECSNGMTVYKFNTNEMY